MNNSVSVCFFVFFCVFCSTQAQDGVYRPLKINTPVEVLKASPPLKIFYFDKNQTGKIKITNITNHPVVSLPEFETFPPKNGKKHILSLPYEGFKKEITKEKKLPPKSSYELNIPLDIEKMPALSGGNIYPMIKGEEFDGRSQRVMNSVVVFQNLKKVNHQVKFKNDYNLTKRGLVIESSLNNLGNGIYYNFKLHHFVTDQNGGKITGKLVHNDFKFLSPTKTYTKRTLVPVNFKDGIYNHILLFKNPGSKTILKHVQKIKVRNGVIEKTK